MKKSDAAKRQGLKSMSKRRSGEKSSKRLGEISPRDSKNEAAATTIKIVIATAPFLCSCQISFWVKISIALLAILALHDLQKADEHPIGDGDSQNEEEVEPHFDGEEFHEVFAGD